MMVHNLSHEMQIVAMACAKTRALPKRPATRAFEKLHTLCHLIIQRAGRFTRPQGKLTLTMSANHFVRKDLLHFLDVFKKAVDQMVIKLLVYRQRWEKLGLGLFITVSGEKRDFL